MRRWPLNGKLIGVHFKGGAILRSKFSRATGVKFGLEKPMKVLLFVSIALVGCSEGKGALVQGNDPISGESYRLEKHEVGMWELFTMPGTASTDFAMLAREGKPIVTADHLNDAPGITVHDRTNSNLAAAELYDNDGDGVYDRVIIHSQDGSHGFSELTLTEDKKWHYVEYSESKNK